MKTTVLQSKLKEGLIIAGKAISRSVSLPILKNILIKTEDNFLNISSTDLEMGIKWWILTKTEKKGEVTVPFSVFSGFVNLLPDKNINIQTKDNNLVVECDNYKTQINGLSSSDFPIIPDVKKEKVININNKSFCEGLSQIIDIPSPSKMKPEISGILFLFSGKKLKIVATDSYRLTEKVINLKESVKDSFSFIIPQKTAKEVVNIFKEEEKDIDVVINSNQILFEVKMKETDHPQVQLFSKLIEGDYPDYESIIPSENKTQVVLEKEDFLNKIKAASVFSGRVNEVNLHVNPKKEEVVITSESPDLGDYNAVIPANIEGDEVKISFNYKFLSDGLVNIKSSQVLLGFNGESNPGVIKPVGKEDFLYVVMPIKNN